MEELISQFVGVRQQLRGDKTALRKKDKTPEHTHTQTHTQGSGKKNKKQKKEEEVKVTGEEGCSGPIRRTVLHQ